MKQQPGMARLVGISISLAFALSAITPALAEDVTVPKGTDIKLAFDQKLSSKTARPGDVVKFHVTEPVMVDGRTVVAEGTRVTGKVVKVDQRRRYYGINAKIQLKMDPIRGVDGRRIDIGFKTKTTDKSQTGAAAGATVGGAVVLGPVGLVAGLFVPGKTVDIKPGDKMTVESDSDTVIDAR
ncbi:MAG TPA: hypothetical protein VKU00_05125 [Chthonomonadaceae bacterium]|nr:hypothetical protein [Chthonomonadaceae bacterium]